MVSTTDATTAKPVIVQMIVMRICPSLLEVLASVPPRRPIAQEDQDVTPLTCLMGHHAMPSVIWPRPCS